jgi:ribonuclease R
MHRLSLILRENRFKNGGVDFSTVEYKFILDDRKYPAKVIEKKSTPATQLIEEFMLITIKRLPNI